MKILFVKTQGRRGGKHQYTKKGYAEIQNKYENFAIAVDVYQGRGETYSLRDTALINIKFPDGKLWSGSINELKELIKTEL
jgi:hypothetical protein